MIRIVPTFGNIEKTDHPNPLPAVPLIHLPQNCTHHKTVTSHRTGVDFERGQTSRRTLPSTPCTPSPVRTCPCAVRPSAPEAMHG